MPRFKNVLICLPTVSQTIMSSTAITVAQTVKALHLAGVNADLHNIDSAEIVTARDMFANMLLHSNRWDALLFVDSDMAFDPQLILKLLARSEEVTAAACPRRSMDLDRLISSARIDGDMARAVAAASNFTVKFGWDHGTEPKPTAQHGFVAASAVGMAVALISRKALAEMVKAGVVEVRHDLKTGDGQPCWSFFKIRDADGHRYGEDYSFCYRWTAQMKRPLAVCVDEPVSHIGQFAYTARFVDLL